jgi:hypothetical protein
LIASTLNRARVEKEDDSLICNFDVEVDGVDVDVDVDDVDVDVDDVDDVDVDVDVDDVDVDVDACLSAGSDKTDSKIAAEECVLMGLN